MIDLLTPPVAADPAAPIAPAAILGDGAPANFAALLGKVSPTPPAAIPPIAEAVSPAIAQIAPILPDAVVDQAQTPVAAVAVVSSDIPPSSELLDEVVAAEPEPVKLPTLPFGFFAQRLPAAIKAKAEPKPGPKATTDDEDKSSEGEAAVVLPIPAPAAFLPVAPLAAPPTPVARADIQPLAGSVDTGLAVTHPSESPADRASGIDLPVAVSTAATKGEITSAEPVAFDTAPVEATLNSDAQAAAPESAPIAGAGRAVEVQLNPVARADAMAMQPPVPAPQAVAPSPILPSMSVALDELFVAAAPDSAWLDRLASDITLLASGESREAHLRINPRSLGEMSIKLEVEGHRTRVAFTVETPQALSMMTDGAPRLTQLVEANGLRLEGATVDLDQRRDGRAASDQQQRETAEPQRGAARARDDVARLVSRTRIATAQERFA